jgi:uncharacterized iron-regulated membrane protein
METLLRGEAVVGIVGLWVLAAIAIGLVILVPLSHQPPKRVRRRHLYRRYRRMKRHKRRRSREEPGASGVLVRGH